MTSFFRAHRSVLVALGTGLAVGVTVTVVVQRLAHTFGNELAHLAATIECLKQDIVKLQESLEGLQGKPANSGYYSVHQSSGEDDDEDNFQEAFEGNEEFERVRSLSTDSRESIDEDNRSFLKLDILLEGSDRDKQNAYDILREMAEKNGSDSNTLWRSAKAAFSVSQLEGSTGNQEEKKRLLYTSKDYASKSLDADKENADAHKWYAIALGSVGDYEGTQAKILNGFKFKEHIEQAIRLQPEDPSALHLMGRWCYGVYMLTWIERKAAAALFATPPTATIDEALHNFMQSEKYNPGKWKENILFIAKCYIAKSDYYSAAEWLEKADSLPSVNQEDIDVQKEVNTLNIKYKGYKR